MVMELLPGPPEVIGGKIKELRQKKGLTQKSLAAATGIGTATLRRVEAGKVENLAIISRVAASLDVAVVKLLDESLECNRCGDCCRQFVIKIPLRKNVNPRGPLLFYNLHENVHAYVQRNKDGSRDMIIQIREKCSMLVEHRDGTTSCKIYWMRPPICRSFPQRGLGTGPDIPRCSMVRAATRDKSSIEEVSEIG